MTAGLTSEGPSLDAATAWPAAVAAGHAPPAAGRAWPSSAGRPGAELQPAGTQRRIWPGTASRGQIAACVESALFAVEAAPRLVERRTQPRYPYPYPVYLTPLDAHSQPLAERTMAVIGRHLSAQVIDFYCPWPLADRRMVASLDGREAGWLGLLVELTWCRFNRHGWYDNGGRFLAVVPSPLATPTA